MGCAGSKPPATSEQFDEVLRAYVPGDEVTQTLFRMIDLDGNGFINWEEYAKACPSLGVTPNQSFFTSVDLDRGAARDAVHAPWGSSPFWFGFVGSDSVSSQNGGRSVGWVRGVARDSNAGLSCLCEPARLTRRRRVLEL
jgi:hypothetical protein